MSNPVPLFHISAALNWAALIWVAVYPADFSRSEDGPPLNFKSVALNPAVLRAVASYPVPLSHIWVAVNPAVLTSVAV